LITILCSSSKIISAGISLFIIFSNNVSSISIR
jgi:hypothetical protein